MIILIFGTINFSLFCMNLLEFKVVWHNIELDLFWTLVSAVPCTPHRHTHLPRYRWQEQAFLPFLRHAICAGEFQPPTVVCSTSTYICYHWLVLHCTYIHCSFVQQIARSTTTMHGATATTSWYCAWFILFVQ